MKTKFGIIGLGGIASRFAKVLNTVEGAELTAVAARDKKRAEDFAGKFSAKKSYSNYIDLIQDQDINIIYIAVPHNFHYEIAKLCLENNKSVLCEKPFFTNKIEAEKLVALAKDKNLLIMEAMWTRCLPTFQKAKEWADNDSIGKVKLIDASFCFDMPFNPENRLYNPNLAGGSLYDAGVYPIEFITGILNEKPSTVKAVVQKGKTGVDEYVAMCMAFESGVLATVTCGISIGSNHDAHIYGTKGHIVVYDFLGCKKCELFDSNNKLVECFEAKFEDGFVYEINHIMDLYTNNKIESNLIPLKDTIDCAEIFDEIKLQCDLI